MPSTSFIKLLEQNQNPTFLAVINEQFKDPANKEIWFSDLSYPREEVLQVLISWAQARFPEEFTPGYFKKADYSPESFINRLSGLVSLVPKTEPGNVPTAKLKQWQANLKDYEDWLTSLETVQDPKQLEKLETLNLDSQIRLIKSFQDKLKIQTSNLLPAYLPSEQKQKVLTKISEHIVREATNAPDQIDEEFCWNSLQDLCVNDPEVDAYLPSSKREELSQKLAVSFSQTSASELASAQEKIIQARVTLAPSRTDLKRIAVDQLGLSPKESEAFVCRLETYWPNNPNPTSEEIQKALSQSLNLRNKVTLQKQQLSEAEVLAKLTPHITGYYLAAPLAQKEQNLAFKGISPQAVRWAHQTNLDPIIMENLLRGVRPQDISQVLTGMKLPQQKSLLKQVQGLDVNNLPLTLRLQIAKAQFKAKVFGLLDKTNPFGFRFYQYHFPRKFDFLKTKTESLNKHWRYLNDVSKAGWILNPGQRFWLARTKITHNLQLRAWRGYSKAINKVTKNKKLRRFLRRLPQTYKPSYWIKQGGRWLTKKTAQFVGKGLIKIGVKLGQKAFGVLLRKAGAYLIKEGFKKLLTKGLVYGLSVLLGAGTSGIGWIVTGALLVFDAVKFILSKKGRDLIWKILKPVVMIATSVLVFLFKLMGAYPLTFALGGVGFAVGSAIGGPAVGLMAAGIFGSIGYFIDTGVVPFFQNLGFGGGGAGAAAESGSGLAAAAGKAPGHAMMMPAAGAGVGATGFAGFLSSIGPSFAAIAAPVVVAGTTIITTIATSSSYIVPPILEGEANPAETENIKIEKTADKTSFSNTDVATPQTIIYTVTIAPKNSPLTNVQIQESVTLNSQQSPPLPQLTLTSPITLPTEITQPTSLIYQITNIDSQYINTRITNSISLNASVNGITENVMAFANVDIGTPPIPASVDLASAIVNAMIACQGLSTYDEGWRRGAFVTSSSWAAAKNCLIQVPGSERVLSYWQHGIDMWGKPQCVGFVMGLGLFAPGGNGNANNYCNSNLLQGGTYWDSLQVGDFVAENFDLFGHVAIVTSRSGDIVQLAETMGDTGRVQFRTIGLQRLKEAYCGYIRQ